MKKAFTQTIIVFVAVNLMMAGSTLAQNVTEEGSQPASKEAVVAEKEIELEKKKAEIAAKEAEKEVEAARKELEAAQKQMQTAMKQVEAAQKRVKIQVPDIPEIEVAIPRISLLGRSGGGAVLVVPAAELEPEDLAEITEDMTVMSRIFDNKLHQARLTTERGGWYGGWYEDYMPFLGRDSGTIEAVYLEGYAALFLMKVSFPLSPSPEEKEEKKTEVEDTDPLWTETKQEIYAPEEADRRRRTGDRQEEKYDAEKVAELKETLIKTLKHAANIRALNPDQLVILTVIGDQSQSAITMTRSYVFSGRSRGRSSGVVLPEPGAEAGSFLPTVLTICAKKSDIDAFAEGELSFDQFRELTRMFTSYAKVGNEGSPDLVHQTVAHEGHYVR